MTDDEWSLIRAFKDIASPETGSGALRLALLAGAVAVAAAVVLTPIVSRQAQRIAASGSVDPVTTGSIAKAPGSTYTIRRSVLQDTPESVCIIRQNGASDGDCP